jgi:hypothetical protein
MCPYRLIKLRSEPDWQWIGFESNCAGLKHPNIALLKINIKSLTVVGERLTAEIAGRYWTDSETAVNEER